jgi:hypothetical protein
VQHKDRRHCLAAFIDFAERLKEITEASVLHKSGSTSSMTGGEQQGDAFIGPKGMARSTLSARLVRIAAMRSVVHPATGMFTA